MPISTILSDEGNGQMRNEEAARLLATMLEGDAVRDRFNEYYYGADVGSRDWDKFEVVCIGCGGDEADFVCTSAIDDAQHIKADAIRRGYSRDEAERIWMIIRGPHCWNCYVVADTPPKKELGQ
jgi:hypothetical protein